MSIFRYGLGWSEGPLASTYPAILQFGGEPMHSILTRAIEPVQRYHVPSANLYPYNS